MRWSSGIVSAVALAAVSGLIPPAAAQTPGVAMAQLTNEEAPGKPVATFRIEGADAPAAVRAISPTGAVTWVALPGGGNTEGQAPLVLAMPCDCDVLPRTSLDGSVTLEMYPKGAGVLAANATGDPAEAEEANADPARPLRSGGANAQPAPETAPMPTRAPWVLAQGGASEVEASEPLTDEAVEMAREQLLAQLTKAAEQGILTLSDQAEADPAESSNDDPDAETSQDDTDASAETADVEKPDLDTVADGLSASGLPLRVTSAFDDRSFRSEPEEADEQAEAAPVKAACIADEYLDVRDWAGDAPAAEQIGVLRSVLVGEFDTPNKMAVRQLARLYIRLGFGAEARAVLRHMGEDLPDAEVLADLSRLVDGDTPANGRPIWIGDDCVGWHALWRAAAMSKLPPASDGRATLASDAAGMLEAFDQAPRDLRLRIGPGIGLALLDNGDIPSAEALLRTLRRSALTPNIDMLILEAKLWDARGDREQADALLAMAAGSEGEEAMDARMVLAERRLDRGERLSALEMDLFGGWAFENRDGALGDRLLLIEARARAVSGNFEDALEALMLQHARSNSPVIRQAAWDLIGETPLDEARHPAELAQVALSHLANLGDGPEGDLARAAFARRLTGAGLAQVARTVLASAMPRAATEVLFAEAEAALQSGEIEQGLAVLDVLAAKDGETEVTARMRAEALTSKGDIEGAARALAAAETDPDKQAELAWASGDWNAAMDGSSPERNALAAYMTGAGELPDEIRKEMDPARVALFESLLAPTELPEDLSLAETKKMLDQVEAELDLLKELREGG